MNTGRFKKGHTAWNKGLKGIHLHEPTEFKKGQHALEKHPFWKGGVQHNKNDCTYICIGEGKRKRRPRLIYEEKYGSIPKGYVIYHIDGNKNNDDIDNLEAIPRSELITRNRKY